MNIYCKYVLFVCALTSVGCSSAITESSESGQTVFLNKDVKQYPIVATVNGEAIDRAFYQKNLLSARRSALMQNQDPFTSTVNNQIRTNVLDQMIGNVLLAQAAEKEEITVDESVIDEQIAQLDQQYESRENLEATLTAEGSSFEELRVDLLRSERTKKFIESYLAELALDVTPEEIQSEYDAAAALQEVPPLEEVQDQIKTQLQQQKEQLALTELINTLRSQADVEIIE